MDRYQTILYHRQGYAGSSSSSAPGSIVRDAKDAAALLEARGIEQAHVVGLSFSGAIALQLASAVPDHVHSLILIEPPPVHVPSAAEFRAANARLQESRRSAGVAAATDHLMTLLMGQHWRSEIPRNLPGSVTQMERDAATFFDIDIPALFTWTYTAADACPDRQPLAELPVTVLLVPVSRAQGTPVADGIELQDLRVFDRGHGFPQVAGEARP